MQKQYRIHLCFADILLIIVLTLLAISGFVVQKSHRRTGRFYKIEMAGKTLYRLPLTSDTLLTLKGNTGTIRIESANGKVRVSESSCPLKICVRTGWIKNAGEAIICVPNSMIIEVEGKGERTVDAITQ